MRHISLVLPALLAVLARTPPARRARPVPTTAPQRASLCDAGAGSTSDH